MEREKERRWKEREKMEREGKNPQFSFFSIFHSMSWRLMLNNVIEIEKNLLYDLFYFFFVMEMKKCLRVPVALLEWGILPF